MTLKSEKEIRKGLKQLEKLAKEDTEVLHIDFNIVARMELPTKDGTGDVSGKVKLDPIHVIKDLEHIIRATEICTLKWVLNKGGGLNTEKWKFRNIKNE